MGHWYSNLGSVTGRTESSQASSARLMDALTLRGMSEAQGAAKAPMGPWIWNQQLLAWTLSQWPHGQWHGWDKKFLCPLIALSMAITFNSC